MKDKTSPPGTDVIAPVQKTTPALPPTENNQILPETGFLRVKQILQIIPVSKSQWWSKVKDGTYPKPIKLGKRTTAWRVEDIRTLIESYSNK